MKPQNKAKIMQSNTTAIYCRVAYADNSAMEMQKQLLLKFANEQSISDIIFYEDNGYSGLNLDRPAFSRLQADMQEGKIKTVIIKNETRIGRSVTEVLDWINKAQAMGVSVISVERTDDALFNAIQRNIIGRDI